MLRYLHSTCEISKFSVTWISKIWEQMTAHPSARAVGNRTTPNRHSAVHRPVASVWCTGSASCCAKTVSWNFTVWNTVLLQKGTVSRSCIMHTDRKGICLKIWYGLATLTMTVLETSNLWLPQSQRLILKSFSKWSNTSPGLCSPCCSYVECPRNEKFPCWCTIIHESLKTDGLGRHSLQRIFWMPNDYCSTLSGDSAEFYGDRRNTSCLTQDYAQPY